MRRERVTAEGAGRSTSVKYEHLKTHRCKLLEKEKASSREDHCNISVRETKNHCILCKRRVRERDLG